MVYVLHIYYFIHIGATLGTSKQTTINHAGFILKPKVVCAFYARAS